MPTAFDQALKNQALLEAAESYALECGSPDSAAYRAAWLRFRRRIRTVDDLDRWRIYQRHGGRRPGQRAVASVTSSRDFAIETAVEPAAVASTHSR